MEIRQLIELAKDHSGLSLGEMAAEMNVSQARISEWKKGKYKPAASVIAYFASKADLPVFETVAEIEQQFDPLLAGVWQSALGKLRAAGVAASVVFTLSVSSLMTPTEARASQLSDRGSLTSVSASDRLKKAVDIQRLFSFEVWTKCVLVLKKPVPPRAWPASRAGSASRAALLPSKRATSALASLPTCPPRECGWRAAEVR